jgi:hypothetical protein
MEKSDYFKHTKENSYTWNSTYKTMARKIDFTLEIFSIYNLQKDKALSASKEKIK